MSRRSVCVAALLFGRLLVHRLASPVPFDAPDEMPVSLVFVLLVPERATDLHLQILSNLAELFSDRDLRAQLASATDALAVQRSVSSWQAQPSKR